VHIDPAVAREDRRGRLAEGSRASNRVHRGNVEGQRARAAHDVDAMQPTVALDDDFQGGVQRAVVERRRL
jgi:hypothetical protein